MSEEHGSPGEINRQEEIGTIRTIFRTDQTKNVQEWRNFHSQVPTTLYHYTTTGGLTGILDSNSLWLSDVRFMNDASELTYATNVIEDGVQEILKTVTDDRLKSALSDVTRFGFEDIFKIGPHPFCVCFCEQRDLLSQWRGYTPGQLGYSLGWDLRNIGTLISLPPNTILLKVIYDEKEQREWVRRVTDTWLRSARTLLDSQVNLDLSNIFPYPAIWALQEAFIELQLCFKNPAFSEEQEWRLIKLTSIRDELDELDDKRMQERLAQYGVKMPAFPLRPYSNAEGIEIKFRQTSLGFVPYVKIGLQPRAGAFTGRLPLTEVIQGPTAVPDLSLSSLILYLRAKGYSFPLTDISKSQIPLRG